MRIALTSRDNALRRASPKSLSLRSRPRTSSESSSSLKMKDCWRRVQHRRRQRSARRRRRPRRQRRARRQRRPSQVLLGLNLLLSSATQRAQPLLNVLQVRTCMDSRNSCAGQPEPTNSHEEQPEDGSADASGAPPAKTNAQEDQPEEDADSSRSGAADSSRSGAGLFSSNLDVCEFRSGRKEIRSERKESVCERGVAEL